MQFEFSLIFGRNFTCLLGKLQNKSISLIGKSISPGEERPFFAHCTMHVYDIHIEVVVFIHVHVAYCLPYLNLQVSSTCTVAGILIG